MQRRKLYAFIAHTLNHARRNMPRAIKKLGLKPEDGNFYFGQAMWKSQDTEVHGVSLNHLTGLRGYEIHGTILDELGQLTPEQWKKLTDAVYPAMITTGGKIEYIDREPEPPQP